MEGFRGFPAGEISFTPLPEQVFTELLPVIDDIAELKATLHCLWLIQQKQGEMRHITLSELLADEVLMRGFGDTDRSPQEALQEGLERAVARGTLLEVLVQRAGQTEDRWYLTNSERGRAARKRIERGEWVPEGDDQQVVLSVRRPSIFNLYEQNFGLIQSAMLAEELEEAEREYPNDWIEDAFRIAVSNNARRWAYVRSILERWAREGRAERRDDSESRRRYIEGEFADRIKH